MSLLSHGAEPSRWETHHILIPAGEELCCKRFFTHKPWSVSVGVVGFHVLWFISEQLRTATTSRAGPLAEAKEGDETAYSRQLAS